MTITRNALPQTRGALLTAGAAASILAISMCRYSIETPHGIADSSPQSSSFAEFLWPGAFHAAVEESLTAVRFAARGKRYMAEVRSDGFSLASRDAASDIVRVMFAGAQAARQAELGEPVLEPIRIFSAHAGAVSGTTIRRFRKATFTGVYPGIDATYRVEDGEGTLEFDFVIHPGANPAAIQLVAAAGTRFNRDAESGDIVASNGGARYRLKAPVAYQLIGGTRVAVPVRLALVGSSARFAVGDYDQTKTLVIDPLVAKYSTFVGAIHDAFYDSINAIATDSAGNVYLGGLTQFDTRLLNETGFPTTPASLHHPYPRSPDEPCAFQCGFILKLDPSHQVVYGALIPVLNVQAVAVDARGSAYATGRTLASTEFPATPGVFSNDPAGQAFAIKLNPAGSALEYAALFVGNIGRAIVVDNLGSAFVTGEVETPGLPTTPGSVKPVYQSTGDRINTDAFLLKINPSGTTLVYGTYLGGTGTDTAYGVTVDAAGRALVVGQSSSSDLVGFPGSIAGLSDAFAVHVSADGSEIVNGKYLGGSAAEHAAAVSSDRQGGYYIAGATESSDFPVTSGVFQDRLLGERNGWITRVDSNFNVLYTTYFGGSFIDGLLAVTADADGNVYAVGPTFSGDMPTTSDGFQDASTAYTAALLAGAGTRFYPISHDAVREAFFGALNADGTRLVYGTYLGGYYTIDRGREPLTFGSSIARAPDGSIYVGGSTSTASFPIIDGGLRDLMAAQADAFLVRFATQPLTVSSPTLLPSAQIGAAYDYQLEAAGGTAPYQWALVGFALPDGLSLSPMGRISGTPANNQTESWGYQFTVEVVDAAGRTAYKNLFVNPVSPGNPDCIPNRCTLTVASGQTFSFPLPFPARAVPPLTLFESGTLPPGISVDAANGIVGGTPTTAGVYDFTFTVFDAIGAQATFSWRVRVDAPNPQPPPSPAPPPPSPPSSGGGGGGGTSPVELVLLIQLFVFAAFRRRARRQHAELYGGERPHLSLLATHHSTVMMAIGPKENRQLIDMSSRLSGSRTKKPRRETPAGLSQLCASANDLSVCRPTHATAISERARNPSPYLLRA